MRLATHSNGPATASEGGASLGSIVVECGMVTPSQLAEAVALQARRAADGDWHYLGELLVERGWLRPEQLESVLRHQNARLEAAHFHPERHPSTQSLLKRGIDLVAGVCGLGLTAAALPVIALALKLESPGPVFVAQPRSGLRGRQFNLWRFRTTSADGERRRVRLAKTTSRKLFDQETDPSVTAVGRVLRRLYLDELPQFWNLVRGDMSLVGTRPPTLDEVEHYTRADWQRLVVKPGLTGLWQVNARKNQMPFEEVLETDFAYIDGWKHRRDLRIVASTFAHVVFGPWRDVRKQRAWDAASQREEVTVLSVPIHNMTTRECLDALTRGFVVTPNVDHVMKLQRDAAFREVYRRAEFRVCDSQVLLLASRFLGTPLKEKISGSDLFPAFCRHHRNDPAMRIFLLGAAPGVADRAREAINRKIGRAIVVAAHSPSFGFEKDERECRKLVELVNASGATVLAVGVGAPKQEMWIDRYRNQMPGVRIFLAIGATIDFEAGNIERAPPWMSRIGMEWLFRLTRDPRRLWKRYLMEDVPFFWLLFQQRLGTYRPDPAVVS